MKRLTTFQQANTALESYIDNAQSKVIYTLDHMVKLMESFNNPQNNLRVVHIAGTSGKTSTSYYAAALLQTLGLTIGLTVSPHVSEINERVQINLTPLSETDFCDQLTKFLEHIESHTLTPSYFEILAGFAYWQFRQRKVDYAVVEVGLGGLVDGTNVATRPDKLCIITDIGLDHVNVLGHTLTKIATQKAGIIQKDNDVFMFRQAEEIMQPIEQRCSKQHARLHIIEPAAIDHAFTSLPLFQQRNFHLAKEAISFLIERDHLQPLNQAGIVSAAQTLIPGRMEEFHYQDKMVILDGAHNAQKLQALAQSIQNRFPRQPIAAVVSFKGLKGVSNYRLKGALQVLTSLVDHIIITSFTVNSHQDMAYAAIAPEIIAQACRQLGFDDIEIVTDPSLALQRLLQRNEQILLVTGSFYLLSDIRPLMLHTT